MSKRTLNFTPDSAVCARLIEVSLDDNKVDNITVHGGCHGNSQAISALLKGMPCSEVIKRLKGIECQKKGTSCADQIAKAIISLEEGL